MLIIKNAEGELLLEKRPPTGIWGGLWVFPQIDQADSASEYCEDTLGQAPHQVEQWENYRHTFSHYHLDIRPTVISLASTTSIVMEADRQLWYNLHQPATIGLAAPIKKLMATLLNDLSN